MSSTRRRTILRTLAFPAIGAAIALGGAGTAAALPPICPSLQDCGIKINEAPNAKLDATPKVADVSTLPLVLGKTFKIEGLADLFNGDVVKFDASGSTDPEGGELTYDWDLDGNGAYELLGKGPKQETRYYATGNVSVKVRVHDDAGNTDTATQLIVVHRAPRAKLTANLGTPLVGQTVTYDSGESTGDPALIKREWDLDGDGTFEASGPSTTTSYATPGKRTVRLRVTDVYGEVSTAVLTTNVNQLPTAAFTGGPGTVGTPVQFDGSGSGDDAKVASYAWDLDGDGTFETDGGAVPTISKTYAAAGTVNVRLRVTDDLGASAVIARSIVIDPAPAGEKLGTTTPQADHAAPQVGLAKTRFTLAKNGKVTFKIGCPAGESRCQGTIKLRGTAKGATSFATGSFNVAGGTSTNVRILLPKGKRTAVRRGSTLRLKAIIAVTDAAGNRGTSTKGILIGL
ncbi:MAG: PKD domain-containing protein [Patulibacter minatonensis]